LGIRSSGVGQDLGRDACAGDTSRARAHSQDPSRIPATQSADFSLRRRQSRQCGTQTSAQARIDALVEQLYDINNRLVGYEGCSTCSRLGISTTRLSRLSAKRVSRSWYATSAKFCPKL